MHGGNCYRIIRIPWKEAFALNSRERVPYMLYLEVVSGDMELEDRDASHALFVGDEQRHERVISIGPSTSTVVETALFDNALSSGSTEQRTETTQDSTSVTPPDDAHPKVTQLSKLEIIDEWVYLENETSNKPPPSVVDKIFGEIWAKKKERLRKSSPCGNQKNWGSFLRL